MLLEFLLFLLLAAGVLLVLWCAVGVVLTPFYDSDTKTLYYIKENAERLEQRVRAFAWLRGSGMFGGILVLVDCGLGTEAVARAAALQKRYEWVELRKPETETA